MTHPNNNNFVPPTSCSGAPSPSRRSEGSAEGSESPRSSNSEGQPFSFLSGGETHLSSLLLTELSNSYEALMSASAQLQNPTAGADQGRRGTFPSHRTLQGQGLITPRHGQRQLLFEILGEVEDLLRQEDEECGFCTFCMERKKWSDDGLIGGGESSRNGGFGCVAVKQEGSEEQTEDCNAQSGSSQKGGEK